MSRSTLAAAKAELYALLWTGSAPTFTAGSIPSTAITVYDHEPRSGAKPYSVTISTAGMSAESWLIALRVYAFSVNDPKTAQDELDLLVPAVDAKAGSNGGFDLGPWELTWDDPLEALVATSIIEVGRQDYF